MWELRGGGAAEGHGVTIPRQTVRTYWHGSLVMHLSRYVLVHEPILMHALVQALMGDLDGGAQLAEALGGRA